MQKSASIEQLSTDVTFEHDRNFYVYTLTRASREAVDTFINHCKPIYQSHPLEKPLFLMIDSSPTNTSSMSPYFKARIQELPVIAKSRNLQVFVAVVLPRHIMVQVVMFFLQKLPVSKGRSHVRTFFDRATALRWLETNDQRS